MKPLLSSETTALQRCQSLQQLHLHHVEIQRLYCSLSLVPNASLRATQTHIQYHGSWWLLLVVEEFWWLKSKALQIYLIASESQLSLSSILPHNTKHDFTSIQGNMFKELWQFILLFQALFHFFLTVIPPKVTRHPETQSVATGVNTDFSIEATGDNLQFQWQKDGIDLSDGDKYWGVNTDTLDIVAVERSDEGDYRCLVKNRVGKLFSDEAHLSFGKLLATAICICIMISHTTNFCNALLGSNPFNRYAFCRNAVITLWPPVCNSSVASICISSSSSFSALSSLSSSFLSLLPFPITHSQAVRQPLSLASSRREEVPVRAERSWFALEKAERALGKSLFLKWREPRSYHS